MHGDRVAVGSRSFWGNGRSSRPWFWRANPLSARLKPEKDCPTGGPLRAWGLLRMLRWICVAMSGYFGHWLSWNMCWLLGDFCDDLILFVGKNMCSLTCVHCACTCIMKLNPRLAPTILDESWGRWVGSSKHFLEEEKFRKRQTPSFSWVHHVSFHIVFQDFWLQIVSCCIVDSIWRPNLCWNWYGILLSMNSIVILSQITSTHLVRHAFLHRHPQESQTNPHKSIRVIYRDPHVWWCLESSYYQL